MHGDKLIKKIIHIPMLALLFLACNAHLCFSLLFSMMFSITLCKDWCINDNGIIAYV